MSHEVENMMFANEVPWHKLGVKVDSAISSRDAIVKSGLDWHVSVEDTFLSDGRKAMGRQTIRSSDGRLLGSVGPDYTPLQNLDAFAFFDRFVSAGEAKYETAGSLRGGQRVWVLARLARDPSVIVPGTGDDVVKFLLLSNGHDGTLSVRVGFTPVCVVCANTMAMAHNDKRSQLLKVKHTGGVVANVEAIGDTINAWDAKFEATADQYRDLASRDIDARTLEAYVKIVFRRQDKPQSAGLVLASQSTSVDADTDGKRLVPKIVNLFEDGRGATLKGRKGTWWGAYNAVTEYLSHERGKDSDNRVNSLWFGDSANVSKRALETAVRMAA